MIEKFHYLKVGLGLVLAFVGIKMLTSDFYKIPIGVSLGIIAVLLGGYRGQGAEEAVLFAVDTRAEE